jgi:aminopeptidase 2
VTGEFTSGVSLDSLRSSHAIEVDVKSPAEINQIFDAISYSKGASVIRMLNSFLGGDIFQKGVCQYLKKHQYANARTVDLWDALAKASGIDVTKMMYQWTRDVGYPMVTIQKENYHEEKKEMSLDLVQTRFLSTGDLTKEEEEKCPSWFVPIGVVTDDKAAKVTVNFTSKMGKIAFPYQKSDTSFYKLNANTTGFYRVCYNSSQLENLGKALERDITLFSTEDRIGIISDAFAFARAGLGSTIGALEILNSRRLGTRTQKLLRACKLCREKSFRQR